MPAIFSQQRVFASATPPPPPPPPAPPPPSLTVSAGASSGTSDGSTISGPTLTAPGGNILSVDWSLTASPSGLTIDPSSGTLTPGQSVTPTLSSITAAIYAITVANNSGGTVTGSAGNVQFYTPPPPPHPLAASLDIIAPAKALGKMWVRLDNGVNSFSSVWPASEYRDPNSNFQAIIYAWGGIAIGTNLVLFGGGHANSSSNQVFEWLPSTRGWRLSYHGSQHINVNPGPNTHRVKDFNGAPVSSHPYCNNVWLKTQNRFFTFGGAAWNDGGPLRVFDPLISGDQPGLRLAGGYSLDMSQAGTNKVGGSTGSNFGPSLEGANAWRLHDWLNPSHPSQPIFSGNTFATHGDRGAVSVVEDGKDVLYYTAGSNFGLIRTELTDSDPMNDVNSFVCSGLDFNGEGEVLSGGNIAIDSVRRLIVSATRGNGSFESFRFVDLKRSTRSWRRPDSPSGDSALKAENKGEPGIFYDTVDQCFVVATRGSSVMPGIFPSGVWKIKPPTVVDGSGFTPDTDWEITRRDAPGSDSLPPNGPFGGELFPTVTGKMQWHDELKVALYVTEPSQGQVWAYIPENWTDPRG